MNRVMLVALAVWPDGTHQIVHYQVAEAENKAAWLKLFENLIARGLDPSLVKLIVSDGAKGLLQAMSVALPNAKQQRCIAHKVRGMEPYLTYRKLPKISEENRPISQQEAKKQRLLKIKNDAYAIYDAKSLKEAEKRLQEFVTEWQPVEPKAVHAFKWGIKRTLTFYEFDESLHIRIRTTNVLERLFREFRNKSDEIGAFPNEQSCLTLFFLVGERVQAKHDLLRVAKN